MRITGSLWITLAFVSCSPFPDWGADRVLLAASQEDQSSIFDSNGDSRPDVQRWYRGSGVVYEKLDENFDGYWDVQGKREPGGAFRVYHRYPEKRYQVSTHYLFYAGGDQGHDKTIIARWHASGGRVRQTWKAD